MNILRIICGRKYTVLDHEAAKTLYCKDIEVAGKKADYGELRARELQVLELAARGMSNKKIAPELSLSVRTVETHFVNIYRKMGTASRLEAIMFALKKGWFKIDEGS
ncbi:MAG: hypothetical protein GQ507_03375, partial [Dehalococcoidales bacterium]|nr:hypothetical protein [Dehalococcoidales bacterium]